VRGEKTQSIYILYTTNGRNVDGLISYSLKVQTWE